MADAPLDIKALEDIYGSETVEELLEMSLKEAGDLVERIAAGVSRKDATVVAQDAHQLKGMCLTMTLNEMSDASKSMELAAKSADWSTIEKLLPVLKAQYQLFVEYLRAATPRGR
ncbi:MAG: Hpt domain-containing protein [Candidatus Obscuribacterales bacterium]|nr:Hpt domain-containing protein [Candidatus Obscuribacterales bacterium]